MLADVQTLDLLVAFDAQAHGHVEYLQNHERANQSEHPSHAHRDELADQQAVLPIDQTNLVPATANE